MAMEAFANSHLDKFTGEQISGELDINIGFKGGLRIVFTVGLGS